MAVENSALAIRSSVGIELWGSSAAKQPYEYKANLPREETKNSRSISFSPDGRYFALTNGLEIKVLQANASWTQQCSLPRPKAFSLKFSPRGNYLCTWELYTVTKDRPENSPNMFVYDLKTGSEVFSIVQKKQSDWEPSWSADESIFALVVGGEALFYDLGEGAEGFKKTSRKIGGSRDGVLSLGPGHCPPFLAFYTPGSKGAPSMCKLYKYPAIGQNEMVACKSFFQTDRVEMLWNKRGTGLLLLTSTEVDKSGASYYGNQAIHFMATKGDSCSVPLSKEGPVHCVKWSPKATEFIVIYGFMPAKATLYNLKCDAIFDFGEGPRNSVYFNPFGNLVVLAGFGNLPGAVEIWDVAKKEQIANMKCPDTTHFEWNPNGEYFVTATTAPRLRISNGFKIYHYSGALFHETLWPQGQELLGVEWQPFPDNTFKEPVITKAKHEGIKSSQPEASKVVYTPPHLRGKNGDKFVPQPKSIIPGLPPGYTSSSSGNNKKGPAGQKQPNNHNKPNNNSNNPNKQQQQPRNRRDGAAGGAAGGGTEGSPNGGAGEISQQQQRNQNNQRKPASGRRAQNGPQQQQQQQQQATLQQQPQLEAAQQQPQLNGQLAAAAAPLEGEQQSANGQQQPKKVANPEKEKKIRNVAKKLSDIKKLKARQTTGETLELNQLSKISQEAKLLDELKALKMT